jgi:hypothetical protein
VATQHEPHPSEFRPRIRSTSIDPGSALSTTDLPPVTSPPGPTSRHRRRGGWPALAGIVVLCALLAAAGAVYLTRPTTVRQTVQVPVSDGTYVVQEAPNTTYANEQTVQAAALDSEHATTYLKFVVPPFASHVASVRLNLLTAAASSGTLAVHAVASSAWSAATTSYANRPQMGGTVTTAPGPTTIGQRVSFDVTPAISGPGTYSFAVTSSSTTAAFAAFGPSQGSKGPNLTVAYDTVDAAATHTYAQAVQSALPTVSATQSPGPSASPSASTSTGPHPRTGGGNAPAVPAGGALCGAYWPPNGQPYLTGFAAEQAKLGPLKSVRYFNPGAPAAWSGNAGAVNRTVIVSFKFNPSDILSGAEDSRMKTWFANAPRDRDVYWSYYHEPEDQIADGDFSAADYRAAWRHLKSLADQAHNPRLYSTLILMQWTLNPQANRNWRDYYPGDDVIDVMGWDVYNVSGVKKYDDPAGLLDPVIALSKQIGKPWGIAELGTVRTTTDSDGTGRAHWIGDIASVLKRSNALWVDYFDVGGDVNNDFALSDAPSRDAWRSMCDG